MTERVSTPAGTGGEVDIRTILLEHAPNSAFPGPREYTVAMVEALCPPGAATAAPNEDLVRKLCEIHFEHKASTPSDDDEYWMARSPFDQKFYVFAATACGGGWPTCAAYVFDERPSWFDED